MSANEAAWVALEAIAFPNRARCSICAGMSGERPITDDGFLVCWPCLLRVGKAAGDPASLTITEAAMLAECHADVVELDASAVPGEPHLAWRWIGWP